MSTHHSRTAIVDALALMRTGQISIALAEGATAWKPGYVDNGSRLTTISGPGAVTYRRGFGAEFTPGYLAAFDPIAEPGDERCEYIREGGDQCLLIDGDHADAHLYDED